MQIHLHQTHHTLAAFRDITQNLQTRFIHPGIHLFPELYLTGYPLGDLCLQRPFIQTYHTFIQNINHWSLQQSPHDDRVALLGGLAYELSAQGVPLQIRNVIYELRLGSELKVIYYQTITS
jgi:NAD+ synthase (glutamine-hydrolysing)